MGFKREESKRIREDLRWTLSALAKQLNVSSRTVSNWECGKTVPSEKKIYEIANILGIGVDKISDIKSVPISPAASKLKTSTKSWLSLFKETKQNTKKEIHQISHTIEKLYNKLNDASIVISGLLRSVHFPVYIKDVDNKYIMVNNAFLEYTSAKEDSSVFGKNDYQFFSREEAHKNLTEDQNVLLSCNPVVNREDFIPGTRKKRWGLITKKLIYDDDDGQIAGIVGVFVDITERKAAEKRRSILEYALNKVPFLIWLQDEYRNNVFVNDYFAEALDIAKQDVYAKTKKWTDLQGSVFLKNRNEQLQNCKKFPIAFDYSLVLNGEKERFFRERIYKCSEKYKIGIVHDITEFLELETIKNDLIRLSDALEEIVSLSRYNEETDSWKVEYINNALISLSGLNQEKVLEDYKVWLKIIHPHDLNIYQEWYNKETYPKEIEYRILHQQTGEIVWIRHKQYKLDNKLYSTVKNITLQKKLESRQKELIGYNSIILSYLDKSILAYWIQELKPKNRILFVNDGYAKLYGVKKKEFYNNNLLWKDFVHPDDVEIVDREINKRTKVFLSNNKYKDTSLTYRIIDSDGCQKKIEATLTVLYVDEKLIIGGFIREI